MSAIAQDQHGAIWLGTDGAGLQRFDGYKITTPTELISENEHHVTSIDPIGNEIYFSSKYKGVYKFKNGNYEKLAINQRKVGEYLALKKTAKGILIVGSKKIRFIHNNATIKEVFWKNTISNLIQFQEINGLVFIIEKNEAFVLTETGILPISEWLKLANSVKFSFLSSIKNKLFLYARETSNQYTVYLDNSNEIKKIQQKSILLPKIEEIKYVYSKANKLIIVDSTDHIFYSFRNKIKNLTKNSYNQRLNLDKVFIDQNNDFWGASNTSGFFKISKEPFTKIELHNVYQNPLISFVYRSKFNEVFMSDFTNKTYVSSFKKVSFDEYNFRIYAQTVFKGQQLFATNKGVLVYKNGKFSQFKTLTGKIIFVFATGNTLFYSPEKEGLYRYENGQSKQINECAASHVYTAQLNSFKTKVYFGTNDGVYEYRLADHTLHYLNSKFRFKTRYAGVSTKDRYGTIWFSLDKSLIGITKQEQIISINNENYFSSTLFYTLNSDNFGNIWIGTNKGITRLKLNEKGNVLDYKTFNKENGFDGYETHMRSCFQDKNAIYLGTIEGLFMLNPASIEHSSSPPKPYIYQTTIKNAKNSVYDEDFIKLSFLSINPKKLGLNYTFRLKGKNNQWSPLSSNTSAYFTNLSDQNYLFEVKATYDGKKFSDSSFFQLKIQTPFWKSTWFVLLLILSVAIGNFILLDRSRNFISDRNTELNNYHITSKMRINMLIFGFISTTVTNSIAHQLDRSIPDLIGLNISLAVVLFVLILIAVVKKNVFQLKNESLKLAFYFIIIHAFVGLYLSDLHSFYVVIICLCSALASIILQTINHVISYSILQFLAACVLFFILDNANYNEVLFLIAIIVSIMINLFNTYIKKEALQKLIFTSSLLNKSSSYVLVFNEKEEITYFNESFATTFIPKSVSLLNKQISQLNLFIVDSLVATEQLAKKLKKEEKLILPMKSKKGGFIWVEWIIQNYTKHQKAMFGVDISQQIRLNEKYQSLYNFSDYLIFSLDIQGKVMEYNNRFLEFFSAEGKQLKQKDSFNFIHEDDVADVREYYENQFKNRTLRTHFSFRVYDCYQKLRWIDQYTELIYVEGSDKYIKGFCCFAMDVTEIRAQRITHNEIENKLLQNYSNISYLQRSLMPDKEKLDTLFSEYRFLVRPKEIISSVFYLAEEKGDYKVVAFSSCNSEGIVSAILTTYASAILKDCITLSEELDPSDLLNAFDSKITQQFKAYLAYSFKLTFELTIVVYHKGLNKFSYASSGGKFISVFGREVFLHKGESKKAVEPEAANFKRYNTYELLSNRIDYLVFFTDGITLQNNPKLGKPFSIKRLLDHFKSESESTLQNKMISLEKLFDQWKADAPQQEDVFVLSVKLK